MVSEVGASGADAAARCAIWMPRISRRAATSDTAPVDEPGRGGGERIFEAEARRLAEDLEVGAGRRGAVAPARCGGRRERQRERAKASGARTRPRPVRWSR